MKLCTIVVAVVIGLAARKIGEPAATMSVTYANLREKAGLRETHRLHRSSASGGRFLNRRRTSINVMGDMNVACILDGSETYDGLFAIAGRK